MAPKGLCFLQSPRSKHTRQNVTSFDSTSLSGLPIEAKQNNLQWVPAKIPLFPSAVKSYSGSKTFPMLYRHTQTHTRQPVVVTSFGSCPGVSLMCCSQPSLQTCCPRALGGWGCPDWERWEHQSSAGTSGSLALTSSTPRFWTGFTNCRQDYKQPPRFHRNVIIPVTLKAIPPLHPLCIGSFTKHILPPLYSKWPSWCTSSNPSYHLSS